MNNTNNPTETIGYYDNLPVIDPTLDIIAEAEYHTQVRENLIESLNEFRHFASDEDLTQLITDYLDLVERQGQ